MPDEAGRLASAVFEFGACRVRDTSDFWFGASRRK